MKSILLSTNYRILLGLLISLFSFRRKTTQRREVGLGFGQTLFIPLYSKRFGDDTTLSIAYCTNASQPWLKTGDRQTRHFLSRSLPRCTYLPPQALSCLASLTYTDTHRHTHTYKGHLPPPPVPLNTTLILVSRYCLCLYRIFSSYDPVARFLPSTPISTSTTTTTWTIELSQLGLTDP